MLKAKAAVELVAKYDESLSKAPTVDQVSKAIQKVSKLGQRKLVVEFLGYERDQLAKVTLALLNAGYKTAREDGLILTLHVSW